MPLTFLDFIGDPGDLSYNISEDHVARISGTTEHDISFGDTLAENQLGLYNIKERVARKVDQFQQILTDYQRELTALETALGGYTPPDEP